MDKYNLIAKDFSKVIERFNDDSRLTKNLIGANNDIEAIMSWLEEFQDSTHTHRTYQKESLRFLLWVHSKSLTLKLLQKQHIHLYRNFLANPTPHEMWCQPMQINLNNKKTWTPFKGPLSEKSIKSSMTILSGMFTYLNHAQFLEANPFKLIKNKNVFFQSNSEEKMIEVQERILSLEEFNVIIKSIEYIKDRQYESNDWCFRARFIVLFLAYTGLRVSELEKAKWSDMHNIEGQWWLKVLGKGQKLARVPINTECHDMIKEYQSVLPGPLNTDHPIICQLNKKGLFVPESKLTARSINFIFKKIASFSHYVIQDSHIIEKLNKISPHWLRHFSASQQALCDIPIHFIKAHHRHSKEDTTRVYIHHEKHTAHNESEKLKILTRLNKE